MSTILQENHLVLEIRLTNATRDIMRLPELASPSLEQAILTVFVLLLKGTFSIFHSFGA